MNTNDKVTAAIIIIGDEILSGRTSDCNINYIAKHLEAIGISLCEVRIIADHKYDIIASVNELRAKHDYLFTTGGIGPTHDDITADCIAQAFSVPIELDERALEMMRQRYPPEVLHGDHLRMARIPCGADLIDNPLSHTPGFMIDNVIVMAGIPAVMQVMLDDITPKLRTGTPILTLTIRVITAESQIAATLKEVQSNFTDLSLGSYPFFEQGKLGTHLVLRSTKEPSLAEAKHLLITSLKRQNLDPYIV